MPRLAPYGLATVAALALATLTAAPTASATDTGRCPQTTPLPSGHVETAWSVSSVNTATTPPEITVFLDKGAGDGVQKGDLVYAVDCRGNMRPGLTMVVESASKSGSSAIFKGYRSQLEGPTLAPIRTLIVDTTHGKTPLPRTTFGGQAGSRPGALTSVRTPPYGSMMATTSQIFPTRTVGYLVTPSSDVPLATFTVDEVDARGSTLRLTADPRAKTSPDEHATTLYYAPTCAFPEATPNLRTRTPAGHAWLKIQKIDRTPDKKTLVTFDKGGDDGILLSSKIYLVEGGRPSSRVPLSIETITSKTVTVLTTTGDRSVLDGKVLVQTATCTF